MDIKKGIYTTELYVTIASMIVTTLVTHNFISSSSANDLTNAITVILGIIVPAAVYTVSRTWLKAKNSEALMIKTNPITPSQPITRPYTPPAV